MSQDVTVGGVSFTKDARLFLDVGTANLNVSIAMVHFSSRVPDHDAQSGIFSDPTKVDPTRHPKEGYLHPDGCFKYLGEPFSVLVMSEVLRATFGYKNITRAPGQSGSLKRFATRPLCFAA